MNKRMLAGLEWTRTSYGCYRTTVGRFGLDLQLFYEKGTYEVRVGSLVLKDRPVTQVGAALLARNYAATLLISALVVLEQAGASVTTS